MPLHKYAHTLIQKNAYMQAFIYTQVCLHRYVFRYTSIQIYYMQKLTYTCIYSTHKREYIPVFLKKSSTAVKVLIRDRALPLGNKRPSELERERLADRNVLIRWRHSFACLGHAQSSCRMSSRTLQNAQL